MGVLDHTYKGYAYSYDGVTGTVNWAERKWIAGAFQVSRVQGFSNLWRINNGEGDWWVITDEPQKVEVDNG
jgi:hypothetical protein